MHHRLFVHALAAAVVFLPSQTGAQVAPDFGFSRIYPGWTNYSTGFNATHEPGPESEFATIACFYTPALNVRPLEFSAILVWFGDSGQRLNFGNFTFQVHLWSSLSAFIQNPRRGDLALVDYVSPTGGSLTTPNAVTRGGRPAYLARFNLTNASLVLTQCQTVLIGLSAQADANRSGELYVPTAPYEGLSDVQGGNIVSFGWTYLADAGGLTIYWGQLATELVVQPLDPLPRLGIQRVGPEIQITWPASAGCFDLEACEALGPPWHWFLAGELSSLQSGITLRQLGISGTQSWLRLRLETPSVLRAD